MLEAVNGAPSPTRWLVFDAEGVTDVDVTGLAALTELTERLAQDDIEVLVARMKPHVRERVMSEGLGETIGDDHFFGTVRAAAAFCATRDDLSPARPEA